ncbi:MAG: TRAP transporter small permease [Synergistetes bacterium]|nr:TRAP transporter small permease [Synergistota bacterium]
MVFFQVINRFILHVPAPWTEEISRYLFVWTSFVGAAKALKSNAHVGTQVLTSRLGRKLRMVVVIFAEAVSLYLYVYIMLYIGSIWAAYGLEERCDTITWLPMFYMYFAIPFSGTLMAIFSVERLLTVATSYKGTS